MSERQSSAVVLGSSVGGLLAARALSAHFERVTIVDRDVLPHAEEIRKGVPLSQACAPRKTKPPPPLRARR
jgi:2-polyprenyl-6-methoxyphenol hydroxylase-like FAD-dependent oxidoreductase